MNNRLYGNLIFELSKSGRKGYSLPKNDYKYHTSDLPEVLRREKDAELPECDELTVVRHYTNLSHNNFGVNDGFYPLGSCTMKYNPIINEEIANMEAFANVHPLQPIETCKPLLKIYHDLQKSLAELTGLKEFTLNPCAGAHGELTGLMIICAYHRHRGDEQRKKVLIPDS
ncbi:MAG: aminomethyl-transferring glycine dehydrogenase subunit GcvPB, partial [Prevotella sp.]|nr:aminomethyl-transferring glycine dehydrogenase subunit GcvPB [Prevotella sp.]